MRCAAYPRFAAFTNAGLLPRGQLDANNRQVAKDPSQSAIVPEQLARLRSQRGWSLAELAARTGLSRPYLSRLESGERQPSLGALITLARVYSTPLHSLVETQVSRTSSPVVLRGNRAQIQRSNGLRYRSISGGGLGNINALHVTVPRRRPQPALSQHEGEELLYVLTGTLNLVFEKESYLLKPGDSAHFDSSLPHRLSANGSEDTEVLLIAYAPSKASHSDELRRTRRKAPDRRSQDVNAPAPASIGICSSLEELTPVR